LRKDQASKVKSGIKYFFRNIEEILGLILLFAICIVAVIKVASRYLFRDPSSWAEEICTYLFVWMSFVGAALALKKHEHFAIEILVDKLNVKTAGTTRILTTFFVIVFSCIVIWYGLRLTMNGWHVVTPATEIPRSIPYAAVPFGGILMLIRSIEYLIELIRNYKKPEEANS
jgi:C4-dicarboxylate transporter DctQ subunit